MLNAAEMIGGLDFNDDGEITPKIVEIDESKFFRRKYHRGRWREGHWVFGALKEEHRNVSSCVLSSEMQTPCCP